MNKWATVCGTLIVSWLGLLLQTCSAQHLIEPPAISPAAVPQMRKLLWELWEPGSENRKQVEALNEAVGFTSPELILGYVANRLNDSRTRDALRSLDAVMKQHPQFLDGWLIKAHLNILGNDYGQGLMSLRSAKRAFDEANATPEQRTEFYRRTGELIGYLHGPVANRVDQNLLKTTTDQLITGTRDEDLATFRAAVDRIFDQFVLRSKNAQERIDEELTKQQTTDAQTQVNLVNQNQTLMQNEQSLRERMNQLRDEFGQAESQLTSHLSPLQSNVASLENQIRSLQISLQFLYVDLANAQNPNFPVWPITIRALLDQIQRTEFTLFNLQANQQSAIVELNQVQAQLQATRANYQRQFKAVEQELKQINRTVTRNQNQLTRIAAGPQIAGGKKEAEVSRVTSLGHYIRLPAVLIRQELIELLESM